MAEWEKEWREAGTSHQRTMHELAVKKVCLTLSRCMFTSVMIRSVMRGIWSQVWATREPPSSWQSSLLLRRPDTHSVWTTPHLTLPVSRFTAMKHCH